MDVSGTLPLEQHSGEKRWVVGQVLQTIMMTNLSVEDYLT